MSKNRKSGSKSRFAPCQLDSDDIPTIATVHKRFAIDLRVRPQRNLPHPTPSTVTRQSAQRDSSRIALRSLADFCQDEILNILRPCLPRKEVIQPHLPIRLPCYDFTPVIGPAFGSSFLAVRSLTSGVTDSHGVTGGVYKTRERIHRSILICDY